MDGPGMVEDGPGVAVGCGGASTTGGSSYRWSIGSEGEQGMQLPESDHSSSS